MKIKIGLAEDNLEFCQILEEYLESNGEMQVVGVAHDGLKALEMVRIVPMDILLLDMIMPKIDGIGVLERMRNLKTRPKIIIFSAFGHEEMTRKAVELGADYFIVKPFDLEILVQRIKETCGQQCSTPLIKLRFNHDTELEKEISNILQKLKIPPHFKGYTYLRKAILLCIKDPSLINEVTKRLYPAIAEEYNSTRHRVERSMRFAIETAWSRGDVEYLHQVMGYAIDEKKGKPTNVSFIAKVADRIRLESKFKI